MARHQRGYDARIGGFTIDLAAFHSAFDMDRTDYTLLAVDRVGHASATTFRNPDRSKRATSTEARLGRQFDAGNINHLATLSLRGGRSIVDLTSNLTIPLGTFDLRSEDPPEGVALAWSGTRGEDTVEQVTASAGYGLAWNDTVQLRFAVHRNRYDKKGLSIARARTARSDWWERCVTAASKPRSRASGTQTPASSLEQWPSNPK